MNVLQHAQISQRRHGGALEDYLSIHALIDSTKKLCSDNRHRVLHTHWAIQDIIIPLFGDYFINADGKYIDTKDFCEKDHLLIDFQHKFIPTLADFVSAIDDAPIQNLAKRIEIIHGQYIHDAEISKILLSPLAVTGQLKSLLLTHNSWFLNEILVQLITKDQQFINFDIDPALFFNQMKFEMWMDNGFELPPSAKANQYLQQNQLKVSYE